MSGWEATHWKRKENVKELEKCDSNKDEGEEEEELRNWKKHGAHKKKKKVEKEPNKAMPKVKKLEKCDT